MDTEMDTEVVVRVFCQNYFADHMISFSFVHLLECSTNGKRAYIYEEILFSKGTHNWHA
jgi:hypothetical protein